MKNHENSTKELLLSAHTRRAIQLLQGNVQPKEVVVRLYDDGLETEKGVELVNMIIQAPIVYSRFKGKQKIWLGAVVIFITLIAAGIWSAFSSMSFYVIFLSSILIWGFGLIAIVLGVFQIMNGKPKFNDKQIQEFNRLLYSVDEVEKVWKCPNCDSKNSNFTYKCEKCGYDLMK